MLFISSMFIKTCAASWFFFQLLAPLCFWLRITFDMNFVIRCPNCHFHCVCYTVLLHTVYLIFWPTLFFCFCTAKNIVVCSNDFQIVMYVKYFLPFFIRCRKRWDIVFALYVSLSSVRPCSFVCLEVSKANLRRMLHSMRGRDPASFRCFCNEL